MTLRRYQPIAKSRGTVIPADVRRAVVARDLGMCIGQVVGMDHICYGQIELDHVRASGGIGMKSRSTPDNLVSLCPQAHRLKTLNGRKYRPLLLAYIEKRDAA